MKIGERTYVIAEIGINHDGDIFRAYDLMQAAKVAGCDAVKFQKRTPRLAVPKSEWDKPKDAPWGETLPYIEYRERMEFTQEQYRAISDYARTLELDWFVSVWDEQAVDDMTIAMPRMAAIKIPSAKLTDRALIKKAAATKLPMVLSVGMSSQEEIDEAMNLVADLGVKEAAWLHCHSAYPAPVQELNLSYIQRLQYRIQSHYYDFDWSWGYSGHETGLSTTLAAVALGARVIERHITHDRAAKGSDHAASVEPQGFIKLVKWIRSVEKAMGDGEKRVWDSELPAREKLRGD